MAKTKHRPGIHLFKDNDNVYGRALKLKPEWYWHIVSRNGRIIARSSETYTRKGNAVKSIKIAGQAFWEITNPNCYYYYDHSKPDTPFQSYL
jgi:uncharacterized protein YegP (UPF0339 family)